MAGEIDGYDERARLRISDADRHKVAELLREAAGEGRLDLEELDERLEAAYVAKTYGDLVPLTADLPVGAQPHQSVVPPSATSRVPAIRYDSSLAIMGGVSRKGVWEVGATHTSFALMGGIDLDLREARFTSRETVIHAYAIWGGIDIYVNERTRVIVDGVGIMGAFDQARDKVAPDLGPDSPVVRVNGFALMAGVTVQRRPPAGTRRRKMLGH
ncbi:MAG: DUF1707 domain-containing protein [Marmoricola sp.]